MPTDGVDQALDATTRRALPVIFLGVGGFYAALVAGTPFMEASGRPDDALIACWAATAAIGLVGAAALYRRPVPEGWSNHVGGLLGLLTVLDSLLLVASAGPQFLFAVVIALVAFALFLLSLPWVAALSAFALAGWFALAVQAGGGMEWTPRAVNLLATCVLALVVQATRIGMLRRLARMTAREVQHQAEQNAMQAERALMEQRTRIVNVTAHELGTPMTPLLLATHMLAQTGLDEGQRRQVDLVQRNLERLQQTIQRVRDAARTDDQLKALFKGDTEAGGFSPRPPPSGAAVEPAKGADVESER